MPLLTKADILGFTPATQDVDVQGVGTFRVREPSAGVVAETFDGGPLTKMKSIGLLAHCLVDEDGKRLFSGPNAIAELSRSLPARAFSPLIEAALEVAGLGADDESGEDEEGNPSDAG